MGHSWWALRYVSHPATAGLFLFRLDDSVEHGNLVFQRGDAGADIAGQSCVSSENWEGEGGVVFGLCSGYSFMAIGIALFRQLQQGVVEVEALHLFTSTNSSRSDLLAISPAFSGNTIFE